MAAEVCPKKSTFVGSLTVVVESESKSSQQCVISLSKVLYPMERNHNPAQGRTMDMDVQSKRVAVQCSSRWLHLPRPSEIPVKREEKEII